MSKETEKAMKEIQEFLAQNATEDMSMDDLNELIGKHINAMNSRPRVELTEKTAKTSDDFLELAMDAEDDAQALKYARKALKLDPNNLDAEMIVASVGSKDPFDELSKIKSVVSHGDTLMKKRGHFDEDVGDFWGILETRPYMRAKASYVDSLITMRMFRKAAAECEDMIRLCNNDNLGMRSRLIALYACLEEEEAALALYEKYKENDESVMLLALSILYFKLNDYEKAEKYLKRLVRTNPDTKTFFKDLIGGNLERHLDQMNDFGYRPYTIEEFMTTLNEEEYLFDSSAPYFAWADMVLRKRK